MALKFKETFYKKPDGSVIFHAIPQVGGDAPAIDFSDVYHYHRISCPRCGAKDGRHEGGCALAPTMYKTPEGIPVQRTPRKYHGDADM